MKPQDIVLLSAFGVTIWIPGTTYYAYHGPAVLEATSLTYWRSFIVSAVLAAAVCIAMLRWRHISPASWASAMLLLAIPGMIGKAVVLSHLTTFMPKLQITLEAGTEPFSLLLMYWCSEWLRSSR